MHTVTPMRCRAAVLLGLALAAAAAAQEKPGKLLAEFKIHPGPRYLVLPVNWDGQEYPFLVDTATPFTMIDASLVDKLGEPKQSRTVQTAEGPRDVHIYYAPKATLGPLDLQFGGPVGSIDFAELHQIVGVKVKGVLGAAFLRRYCVQIDFEAGRMRFYRADEQPKPQWGEAIPLRVTRQGLPGVMVTLYGDLQVPFIIDSGYGDTGRLNEGLFNRLQATHQFPTAESTLVDASGETIYTRLGRIETLQLAKLTYKGLIFDRGRRANILGLGFLARHLVTLDYPNLQLYLKKASSFGEPDEADMSGLHLVKTDQGIEVHSVDRDSPATKAGLKKGDLIERIDGKVVTNVLIGDIRRLLQSTTDRSLKIVFRRDGKLYQTTLTLKRRL